MAQNIYDNDEFFAGYARLPRSIEGLEGAPEWPALRALLPDLRGRKILDLGCGYGWFCRWACNAGAAEVLGIDVSEKMLARARADTPADTKDAAITYRRADMESLALPSEAFDLVYSSLALHYIEDVGRLMAEAYRSLAPGGSMVFSTEHPIYSATAWSKWTLDAAGRKVWPVDNYLDEGPRTTNWLAPGVIRYHRTIATTVNLLLQAGFAISHLEEWGPSEAQIRAQPSFADERHRPPFLIVAAKKP
jgi:ubiquinone/menaquinone biosynthesis C-methylase UbiE